MSSSSIDLKLFRAELHIHTVLSPCAAVEMIPPLIIEEALHKGINIIAITDHNAIDNIGAVIKASEGSGITVLSGLELQTREEIHTLCLFDKLDQAQGFFNEIKGSFPSISNNIDYFGEQFIVDSTGDFVGREDRLLITSSNLTLKELFGMVYDLSGLLIPAHVNRSAFGLLPVLGMVPTDIDLEFLEISRHLSIIQALDQYPELSNFHLVQGGDAHALDEIRGWNQFKIASPTLAEIKMALKGKQGRSYNNLFNNI